MSAAPARIDNLRRSGWKPAPVAVAISLLLLLGLLGVTVPASYGTVATQARLEQALEERRRGEELLTQLEDAGRARELAASERAAELLRAGFPSELRLVETYARLRLAAEASGLALEKLDFGQGDAPLAPAGDGRWLRLATVDLGGTSTPQGLLRFLALLRAGGHPTAVTRLSLFRESLTSPRFTLELTLGLPHLGEAPAQTPDQAELDETGA